MVDDSALRAIDEVHAACRWVSFNTLCSRDISDEMRVQVLVQSTTVAEDFAERCNDFSGGTSEGGYDRLSRCKQRGPDRIGSKLASECWFGGYLVSDDLP